MFQFRLPRRRAARLNLECLEDRATPSISALGELVVDPIQYAEHQLIVALRPEDAHADLAAIAPDLVLRTSPLDTTGSLLLVELQPGVTVPEAKAFFQTQSYVEYAEPDFIVSVAVVPNDPSLSKQWGLHNIGQTGGTADADIDAPAAWDTRTSGVTVAVIDTGIEYTHPDLAANIWTNAGEIAGNGFDDDGNGYIDDVRGWDFANNDNDPMDDHGHGTHVAGIIGAVGNNGIGVSGVAWNVQLMPLKFLGSNGSGSTSGAVAALNYAVAKGVTISNNSWGGGGSSTALQNAINAARAAGHIFVAAAGNSSSNNDQTPTFPANYNSDNVVAVASTTSNDALSSFSNYGATTVKLGAPGSGIYNTYLGGGYASLSGTSMAAPFVAGAIAIVRDQHPDWSYAKVIGQILSTADPIPALAGKTITGARLNLQRAVSAWQFVGGSWTQSGGSLSQTSTANADPRKALLVNQTYAANVEVAARVRVDTWVEGDYARAGVGLYTDVATGKGYNLLFHGASGSGGTVQFLDDAVKWGNAYSFSWTVGSWYNFKLKMDQGVLYGKVWQDGDAEPTMWQFTQAGWTGRSSSGAPALNGGSAGGGGNATASFDGVVARNLPAAPTGVTATAVSSSQIDLNWTASANATGYKVYRSADGSTNWAVVGTSTDTSFSNTNLAAGTTYHYRVAATTAAGDSGFSAIASATTPANGGGVLFSDDFGGPTLDPAWQFVGGSWSHSGGSLHQTSTAAADPRKAMVVGPVMPPDVEVQSRVRVDSWADGDYARAGVGLYTDPTTGRGYNLLFHNTTGAGGTVQFLDDGVKWGNAYSFAWNVGEWYTFKLRMQGGVLYGKVWKDGEAEPGAWQFTQAGFTGRSSSGAAALNGGSAASGPGNATVSFDDVVVRSV